MQSIPRLAAKLNFSRSRLIREALTQYVEAQRQQELRELLKEGYLFWAEESRQLAQEFFAAEQEVADRYAPWEV